MMRGENIMHYLRLVNFKEKIGDTVNFHYEGLDERRFIGSFILVEEGVEACYIKYDDDMREEFPEGVEIISQEAFMERNEAYQEEMYSDRIDYQQKVIDLENKNSELREEFANYRAEQDLLIMQMLLGGMPQ